MGDADEVDDNDDGLENQNDDWMFQTFEKKGRGGGPHNS